MNSGFAVKRTYPGTKGLYIEFFTSQAAKSFYTKGLANGSDCFELDENSNTVIMKTSEASITVDAS